MIRNHHVSVVELSKGVSVGMAGGFVLWVCQFLKFSKNSKFIKITLYVTCLNGGYDKCVSRGGSGCVNLKKKAKNQAIPKITKSHCMSDVLLVGVSAVCQFSIRNPKISKITKMCYMAASRSSFLFSFYSFLICIFVGGCLSVGVSMCVSS